MHRRDFLKYQVLAAGSLWLATPAALLASATPDLAMVTGKPGAATRAAVETLGGMGRFVKAGQRVVLKPNMSFPHPPERATTTHPEVVRELALMCLEAGAANVAILDHPLRTGNMCAQRSGIDDACAGLDHIQVRTLETPDFYARADFPDAEEMRENQVMREVLQADVLISAPVAKSHSGAGVSLSMKNLMGLILDRRVMHSRHDLHTAIVDLAQRLRPNLAVVDASRVLTTNGPGGPGEVDQRNMVIASADFVAADAAAVAELTWYGRRMRPDQVKHIRLAAQRGVGRMDVENLAVARLAL